MYNYNPAVKQAVLLQTFEPPHDKTKKMTMRPTKTQICLGIHQVWSESSLCAQWVAMNPRFLQADSNDSDQTGRTVILFVLSCGGSISIVLTLLVLVVCVYACNISMMIWAMVLFVLCKLILQMRMRSHPVGLDAWFFGRTLQLLPYFMCANNEGSGETALVAFVISAIISWAGSFINEEKHTTSLNKRVAPP